MIDEGGVSLPQRLASIETRLARQEQRSALLFAVLVVNTLMAGADFLARFPTIVGLLGK